MEWIGHKCRRRPQGSQPQTMKVPVSRSFPPNVADTAIGGDDRGPRLIEIGLAVQIGFPGADGLGFGFGSASDGVTEPERSHSGVGLGRRILTSSECPPIVARITHRRRGFVERLRARIVAGRIGSTRASTYSSLGMLYTR